MNSRPIAANENAKRRQDAYRAARKHSRSVSVIKVALPLIAVLGTAWLTSGFFTDDDGDGPSFQFSSLGLQDGAVKMENPEVTGVTADNRPYRLIANEALQYLTEDRRIEMDGIDAAFTMPDGSEASLRAPAGVFIQEQSTLNLKGRSTFATSEGIEVNFNAAQINIGDGEFKSDAPVTIKRSGSTIDAGNLNVTDGGKRFLFGGGVRLMLEPGALSSAKADE
ncbi:MAG: LPS export ABC transporter periplasmic protein LptC [Pseudomonadota bacterium]